MTVRKRYGVYYTEFRIHGKRIQLKVPGGVTNKQTAQQYEDYLKGKMLRGEIGLERINPDVSILIEAYLNYSRTNKSRSSFQRDELALKNFFRVSGIQRYSELTASSIEKFKDDRASAYQEERGRPISKRTINIEIGTVKKMMNKLVELEIIPENPIKSVRKIRGPELKSIEFLTRVEIRALLEAATPTFRPIIYIFLKTGLRRNELLFLEWSDIDFEKQQIRVINKEERPTKHYRERYVPIDDAVVEILESLRRAGPRKYVFPTRDGSVRRNNLLREVKRTAKKAGIDKNVTVHMLRHTYASHLVMSGVDLATVKEILGHSDITTTLRYAHLAPGHLRDAVKKLKY